jgi:hypothetical protein
MVVIPKRNAFIFVNPSLPELLDDKMIFFFTEEKGLCNYCTGF